MPEEERVGQLSFVRGLYEQFRQLIHEVAKFGVVGLVGFVINAAGYDLLHYSVGIGPLTSVTIATIGATIVTFVGNRYWTFRHRSGSGTGRETALFFGLNGVGLLIQYACIGFTNYALGLTDKLSNNVALLIGIGLGTLFRFWSYRKWVWVAPQPTAAAGLLPAAHEERAPVMVPPGPAPRPDWPGAGR